jgi:TonB family protein
LTQNDTAEIVLIEKEKEPAKKSQTFVTNPDPQTKEDLIEKLKDQADYLSQFTKRVKKEVIARNKDTTKNAKPAQAARKGDPEGIAGMQARGQGDDGFLAPGGDREMKPINNVAIGQSSIAEYIPGVEEGAFTALNTDQFTYYAFFARMNEQVRNRWVALIREYMDRLPADKQAGLAAKDRQTHIEIILTAGGEFHSSIVHNTSGDRELDQTTVAAFRRAAPFLNPPKEMVESDGLIHLRYGFLVRFRPPGLGPAGG